MPGPLTFFGLGSAIGATVCFFAIAIMRMISTMEQMAQRPKGMSLGLFLFCALIIGAALVFGGFIVADLIMVIIRLG